jgi:hypothetical protein
VQPLLSYRVLEQGLDAELGALEGHRPAFESRQVEQLLELRLQCRDGTLHTGDQRMPFAGTGSRRQCRRVETKGV